MFKITPIQEKSRQKELAELSGAEFRPDAFGYQMYDLESGEMMGFSQFEIGDAGMIYDLREIGGKNDFEAMFILGRQTMNFIESCGTTDCYADKDAGDARLLSAIGFKEKDGKLFSDMTGMFDGHCSGHAVKLDET